MQELNRVYGRIVYVNKTRDIVFNGMEETKYNNIDDDMLNELMSNPEKTIIKFIETTPEITTIFISGNNENLNKDIVNFVQSLKLSYYCEEFKNKWLDAMRYLTGYENQNTLTTSLECILHEFNTMYNSEQCINQLKKVCEFIVNYNNPKGVVHDKIHTVAKCLDDVLHMNDEDINSNVLYRAIGRLYHESVGDDQDDK